MAYTPKRSNNTKTDKPRDKKKIAIISIIAVLAVVVIVILIFALKPAADPGVSVNSNKSYVPETQSETTFITKYYDNGVLPTSGERHDITIIYGGGANASDVEGSWSLDDVTVYEFDGQGRGIMLTAVDNYTFLYSAENGKLGIDLDTDGGNDFEYTYSVNGDTLTMTRGGKTYTLTKQAPQ